MYRRIRQHPGTRKLYADHLVQSGVIDADDPERYIQEYREHLDRGELLYNPVVANVVRKHAIDWTPFIGQEYTDECDTSIPAAGRSSGSTFTYRYGVSPPFVTASLPAIITCFDCPSGCDITEIPLCFDGVKTANGDAAHTDINVMASSPDSAIYRIINVLLCSK